MKTGHFTQQKMQRGNGGSERRRFIEISREISATIGSAFFESLVEHLRGALEADCVYVGEFAGGQVERVQVLAAWGRDERVELVDFPLAGSPDAEAAIGRAGIYSDDVTELFPSAELLKRLEAKSFVGLPLNDPEGQPAGVIVALFRRAIGARVHFVESMLTIFVPRAAAELARKQAEDALRESEQRYHAFILENTDAMWRIEFEQPIDTGLPEAEQLERILRHGYLAECNDALARQTGAASNEQLIGSQIMDILPPQADGTMQILRDIFLAFIRSRYQHERVEVARLDTLGDQRYFLRSQWGIVSKGMLQRIWGRNRDITELRNSQLALANAERRLTDILEAVHLFAVVLADDESVSFCNDYLVKSSGRRADEILGKNWFELMIPLEERDRVRAAFGFAGPQSDNAGHCEATLVQQDGRRRLTEWDSIILRDSSGKVTGAAAIGRDNTEYRSLEAQLRQSQKLHAIGQLAGGVAHDFNNLLTVIRGYCSLLLDQTEKTAPSYLGLTEIAKAVDRGAVLTRQLLAFSRRKVAEPQILNLNNVINEIQRVLKSLIGERISLTLDLDPALESVMADPDDMHRVLVNLAINARDAMPEGGILTISTSNLIIDEASAPRLKGTPPGRYVQLTVADSGSGMTEEVKAHLFEPFFTTKATDKGSGLGLAVVYGIVQQSGGHILVEATPEKGSTFEILLPRVPGSAETSAAVLEEKLRGGSQTILLVENQTDLRNLLVTLLGGLGYTILEADNSRQALNLVKSNAGPLHLIITDLPGILGRRFLNAVRAAHPMAKVLYIRGRGDGSAVDPLHFQGRAEVLQKSFTAEELLEKVREILEQR